MGALRLALALGACVALAACGGGGAGGGDQALPVLDFGTVSGAESTTHPFTITNPLDIAARVRIAGAPTAFQFVAPTLPTGLVPAGGSFSCTVVATPAGPGPLQEDIALEFYEGSTSVVAGYTARATVEDVRVTPSPATVTFGPSPFGADTDRLVQVRNDSVISTVRFVGGTFPTVDMSIVDPPVPFTLSPGQSRFVTLRCRPYQSMAAVDAAATLRSAGADGSVALTVKATPIPGTAILDFGTGDIGTGLSDLYLLDVPAHVWAVHVETWRPGHPPIDWANAVPRDGLAAYDKELISLATFEGPGGRLYHQGWNPANGSFAACLPRSHLPADQVASGGGTYRFRFKMTDAPGTSVPIRVRAVLKATTDGVAPLAGILDLNLWIDGATGLTATTARTDPTLQAGLAAFDQMYRTVGIQLGSIDYYDCVPASGGSTTAEEARYDLIYANLPSVPGVVKERMNVFVGNHNAGLGFRIPGCAVAYSNTSAVSVGYTGNLAYLFPHECGHHLGLWHLSDAPMDVASGGLPANLMDATIGQTGNTISVGQGRVMRAHPFVR